jgi:glycosyltransferase involved in cell wall biosynthesis
MRLLIFSKLFYPHGGGAELATWLYSKLLANEGFEVTIVTKQFPNEPSVESLCDRIAIFRIPMKVTGSRYDTLVNAGVMAKSFLNKLFVKSDVIYIPTDWYSAIPIAKMHSKPVIVHLHNYAIACSTSLMYNFETQRAEPSSLRSFILHEMIEKKRHGPSVAFSALMNESLGRNYNHLAMLGDALIFVSSAQMNITLPRIPQIREKSYVIHNPLPNEPHIRANKKGIGYFGGKSTSKGLNVLLKALESLRHVDDVEAYLAMTSAGHITRKLRDGMLINFLPRIDPRGIMKDLNTVVIPSLCPEPLPYTLIESMLYGKLVIASSIGGIPEITNGTGLGVKLTNPGNSAEITEALASFLELELDETTELGMKNREGIQSKLNNASIVKSFISILDEVCA